jgi:hypothetical protein
MWLIISNLKHPRAINLSGARLILDTDNFVVKITTWEGMITFSYEDISSAKTFYNAVIYAIKNNSHCLDTQESNLSTGKVKSNYPQHDIDDVIRWFESIHDEMTR